MLNPEVALELAGKLRTVPDFPRDEDSIKGTAEDFIDLTGDLSKYGEVEQARIEQLIQKVRREVRSWTQWGGTAAMCDLYRKLFCTPVSHGDEYRPIHRVPRKCKVCRDTGAYRPKPDTPFQWCECPQGVQMSKELPKFLALLNQQPAKKPRKPAQPLPPGFKPITQTDVDRELEKKRRGTA